MKTPDIKGECNWYWNEEKGQYDCDCDLKELINN